MPSVTAEEGPKAETFCLLIYTPCKVLINPSKLISRHGNEPLQHYNNSTQAEQEGRLIVQEKRAPFTLVRVHVLTKLADSSMDGVIGP